MHTVNSLKGKVQFSKLLNETSQKNQVFIVKSDESKSKLFDATLDKYLHKSSFLDVGTKYLRKKIAVLLFALFSSFLSFGAYSESHTPSQVVKSNSKILLGSAASPLAIKILPAPDAEEKAAQQEEWRKEKAGQDLHITQATVWLAIFTFFLMLFTGKMWIATVDLGKEAKATSDRQAAEMQSSLKIAEQSAKAMSEVAEATRNNAVLMQNVMQKQMRAYLVADIGAGVYQDKNLKFGASPVLLNTGLTPAKNVSYKIEAGVFDPADVNETLLSDIGDFQIHDAVLSPKQTFVIQGVVKNRFLDNEVEEIMKGDKKRLFVWGTVNYDDIFGNSWVTNFCHHYNFYLDGEDKVRHSAFYHRIHNNAS